MAVERGESVRVRVGVTVMVAVAEGDEVGLGLAVALAEAVGEEDAVSVGGKGLGVFVDTGIAVDTAGGGLVGVTVSGVHAANPNPMTIIQTDILC